MKSISIWMAIATGVLIMLNGCQTPQGMSKLTVTDNQEKDYKWPTPKTHFPAGEMPVVRVIGCEGENITLQLVDVSSGKIERETSGFFPKAAVHVEPERIKMGTVDNSWNGPVVPVRYKQIDIYKSCFFGRCRTCLRECMKCACLSKASRLKNLPSTFRTSVFASVTVE